MKDIWIIFFNGSPRIIIGQVGEPTQLLQQLQSQSLGMGLTIEAKKLDELTDRQVADANMALTLALSEATNLIMAALGIHIKMGGN